MTDLIIIGAGPGGYETAVKAAKAGLQVTVIEAKAVGGTCLNEGCIPTKCFCRNAEVLEDTRNAACYGIATGEIAFDLSKAVARKEEVIAKLAEGIRTLMKTPGITFIEGKARFVDSHTIEIVTHDGHNETVCAKQIIIATGSVTKYLPIEGAHCDGVVTSTEMLSLTALPRRLCIIGGGVIGLEFASIFHTFGSEVTVVEFCKEILPNFDRDIAKRLRTSLKKKGITFKTGAAVTAIRPKEEEGYTVVYEEKGKTNETTADLVLMAVGRAANIDSLNLADIGIDFTPRGIKVDDHMQTNIPGVYAIGDINGLCQLAHAATFQGLRALNHILGKEDSIRLDIIPAAVFTSPEAATVGLTEEALGEQGTPYTVHKAFYRANGKALSMNADEGMVKILAGNDGTILGAHIFGHSADVLIHEIATIMNRQGTVEELRNIIHAHPTLSELILAAAEDEK